MSYKIESYASNEHFYCFGANRIKIAKSVQKTSKSSIFCTDFIIFSILAKNGVFNTNRTTGEADDPQAGVNEINAERSLRHIYELSAWLVTQCCRKLHERPQRTEHHALMSRLQV